MSFCSDSTNLTKLKAARADSFNLFYHKKTSKIHLTFTTDVAIGVWGFGVWDLRFGVCVWDFVHLRSSEIFNSNGRINYTNFTHNVSVYKLALLF